MQDFASAIAQKNVGQMTMIEFAEFFRASPKEALDSVARDYPNTFTQTTKSLLNISESEAERLQRIQQNGTGAISWEEKELLEKIMRAAASHEATKKLSEEVKLRAEEEREEAEEIKAHAKNAQHGLPSNLGAMSHGQQVEHIFDHFMHGGSVDDLVANNFLTQQQADKIKDDNKAIKEKAEAESEQKAQKLREELREQGLSEEEINARVEKEKAQAKRRTEEEETRKKADEARRNGDLRTAAALEAQARAINNGMVIASDGKLERDPTLAMSVKNNLPTQSQIMEDLNTVREAKRKLSTGGIITESEAGSIKSLEHLNIKDKAARMAAQREDIDRLALSSFKTGTSALSRSDALDAMKNNVLTTENISNAKESEKNSATFSRDAASQLNDTADNAQEFGTNSIPQIGGIQLASWRNKTAQDHATNTPTTKSSMSA